MTKPRNFPGRKAARQGKSEAEIKAALSVRTKKTPKTDWTAARHARQGGRISR